MQVTKEGIDRIKSANELAAVITERGIEIKRAGKGLVASCPFHEEKTPSFTITPSKGLFHCFGCGVSGDVIGFVTRYDRVSFPKALEILAGRASLSLEKLMEKSTRSPGRVSGNGVPPRPVSSRRELLARIVQHYHRTFCEREDAQDYL
ncbi:MAG: CHC2 zinc finger domain-containing protein, partial [Vicinamibacteria bacterium]